nr:hypothetical protein [uncultured Rhodopila sp.]
MKKEALMALLADLPDGSEIRIPAPVFVGAFDEEKTTLRWQHRLPGGLAGLFPAVATTALMLIMIGFTILGARWLASGGNLDQAGHGSVLAGHQKVQAGRLV